MSRRPYFGQTPGIQTRGINMQVATQGARDMARGLANFGEAIGGSIQKFKAKKEKEAIEGETEQALLAMGLPTEVAKAGSKDKNLIGAFMQQKQIGIREEQNEIAREANKFSAGAMAKQKEDARGKVNKQYFTEVGVDGRTAFAESHPEMARVFNADSFKGYGPSEFNALQDSLKSFTDHPPATSAIQDWMKE